MHCRVTLSYSSLRLGLFPRHSLCARLHWCACMCVVCVCVCKTGCVKGCVCSKESLCVCMQKASWQDELESIEVSSHWLDAAIFRGARHQTVHVISHGGSVGGAV